MMRADPHVPAVAAGPAILRCGRRRSLAALLACLALAPAGCAKRSASGAPDAATTSATDAPPAGAAKSGGEDPDQVVVDPFCGMKIKRGEAAASAEWRGTTYWFCLADHRDAFLADPQRALCRPAGGDAGPECDGR